MPKPSHPSNTLSRAKRMFLINLGLCLCLALVVSFLRSNDPDNPIEAPAPSSMEKVVLTLPELAHLQGQILALREHPKTVPDYEVESAMQLADKEIERDPRFSSAIAREKEMLVQAFFDGYTERFNDYYNPIPAIEFGYQYGVKYNPEVNGYYPYIKYATLRKNRVKLEKELDIQGEAEWRLFCESFQQGYEKGYPLIEEGITIQSHSESIRLFDE